MAAALMVLTFAAHAPALRNGLVWDDTALLLRDPLIRSWRLIPEQFQQFLFTDATASNFYRPMQRLTYTVEYWVAAFQPALYHFSNLLLHAAAAIALFAFSSALLQLYGTSERQSLAVAAPAAVAWVLHPLHSAVVDYVSGRADSLAACFGFVALFFAVQALRLRSRAAIFYLVGGGFTLLASALSKESGLTFTLGFLLIFFLRKEWRRLSWAVATVAVVLTVYGAFRMQAGKAELPQFSQPAPALVRPIIAARALAEYTGLLIIPTQLHMERDVESHPSGLNEASVSAVSRDELQTVAGAALFGAALWWIWRAWKNDAALFALLLLGAISYAPVSGLLPLNASVAEHWVYVPSAFLFLAVTRQLWPLLSGRRAPPVCMLIGIFWIGCLGVRSFYRAQDWRNQRTFLEHTIASGGDSARMFINLSALEMRANNLGRARELAERARAKEPGQPLALLNLAGIALEENEFRAARELLTRAQTYPAIAAQAQEMLAVLEMKQEGRIDLLRLRLAAHSSPRSWPVERHYVHALAASGDTHRAMAELVTILRDESYRAESWQLLAGYLEEAGRWSEAQRALSQARSLDVHLREHSPL